MKTIFLSFFLFGIINLGQAQLTTSSDYKSTKSIGLHLDKVNQQKNTFLKKNAVFVQRLVENSDQVIISRIDFKKQVQKFYKVDYRGNIYYDNNYFWSSIVFSLLNKGDISRIYVPNNMIR